MRSIRASFILRCVTIFLVMSGWFVLSNHCALATDPSKVEAHQCCENGKPASPEDQPAPSGTIICCKALQALTHDTAKVTNLKPDLSPVLLAVAWLMEFQRQDDYRSDLSIGGDTAPPLAFSFVELVLQRSLLAHAPPTFA